MLMRFLRHSSAVKPTPFDGVVRTLSLQASSVGTLKIKMVMNLLRWRYTFAH